LPAVEQSLESVELLGRWFWHVSSSNENQILC
jgi:hypothetical protein